jgi:hypothetical protein
MNSPWTFQTANSATWLPAGQNARCSDATSLKSNLDGYAYVPTISDNGVVSSVATNAGFTTGDAQWIAAEDVATGVNCGTMVATERFFVQLNLTTLPAPQCMTDGRRFATQNQPIMGHVIGKKTAQTKKVTLVVAGMLSVNIECMLG